MLASYVAMLYEWVFQCQILDLFDAGDNSDPYLQNFVCYDFIIAFILMSYGMFMCLS